MKRLRYPILAALIIINIFYTSGILDITKYDNYAITCAVFIVSITSVFDTYAKSKKIEKVITYILYSIALALIYIFPRLNNIALLDKIMNNLDSNILLILSLFFSEAGNWARDIKLQDIKNNKEKHEV